MADNRRKEAEEFGRGVRQFFGNAADRVAGAASAAGSGFLGVNADMLGGLAAVTGASGPAAQLERFSDTMYNAAQQGLAGGYTSMNNAPRGEFEVEPADFRVRDRAQARQPQPQQRQPQQRQPQQQGGIPLSMGEVGSPRVTMGEILAQRQQRAQEEGAMYDAVVGMPRANAYELMEQRRANMPEPLSTQEQARQVFTDVILGGVLDQMQNAGSPEERAQLSGRAERLMILLMGEDPEKNANAQMLMGQ